MVALMTAPLPPQSPPPPERWPGTPDQPGAGCFDPAPAHTIEGTGRPRGLAGRGRCSRAD
ncbi:MAG: hypothetical protein ACK56I_17505 [bacterium]